MESHVEYEAGEHYSERFVFMIAKAANQIGINYHIRFKGEGADRKPVVAVPEEYHENIERRAFFLFGREKDNLPLDPLPDGSWPDTDDEYAEPILVNVAADEERQAVVLDLGRSLRAMTIHPSAARSLAMWLMTTANQVGTDDVAGGPMKLSVAYVKEPESGDVKQATFQFQDFGLVDSTQSDD